MNWLHFLQALQDFHFLRPMWFTALIPAIIAGFVIYRSQADSGSWSKVISPELLPYLIDSPTNSKRRNLSGIWFAGWLIAIIALAGPTFERTPLPVHKQESFLVVAFDLSPSMLAQDLTPNRLSRARLKLIDLLKARKEGSTGLVAYGGDAFVVSPLTDDAATIAAMVPALDPNILPSSGSNVEAAIEKAVELILNTGQPTGDILLITDEVSNQGKESLQVILRSMDGFRLFILGIGTEQGAPIPLNGGGFAKGAGNNIVVPKLNNQRLRKLAEKNGGVYTALTADDSDIEFLNHQFEMMPNHSTKQLDRTFDSWHDLGYWATLLLIPLLLLTFRKGLVACLILSAGLGALPQKSLAFEFKDLWQTPDQQAAEAMETNDPAAAEQLFENSQWKAAAAYRNNNFEDAEQLFSGEDPDTLYNKANALAKAGKLPEAIEIYDKALEQSPDMEDASHNKKLVENLLSQNQQEQQEQQGSGDDQQEQKEQGEDQQEKNQDENSQQSQDHGDASDQQGDQESSEQQNNQQQDQSNNDEPSEQNQQQQNEDEKPQDQQPKEGEEQQNKSEQQQAADQSKEQQAENAATSAAQGELSDEEEQAVEQWLRRIPDDPGGLLRRKFEAEAQKRREQRRWNRLPPTDNKQQRW